MASNQVNPNLEESLYEHRIVVCFEEIKIKIDESAECKIRYKYSLFGSEEFISDPFPIEPGTNESQEIPSSAFWEHFIPPDVMNEGDLKTFLKNHPLSIKLYEKKNHLGTVTINMGKLYEPESQKRNPPAFKEFMNIMSTDSEKVIGTF